MKSSDTLFFHHSSSMVESNTRNCAAMSHRWSSRPHGVQFVVFGCMDPDLGDWIRFSSMMLRLGFGSWARLAADPLEEVMRDLEG
jgi:hypothetical protein